MSQIDGKELRVTPAGFADVMALQESISAALLKVGVKIDLSGFTFTKDAESTEMGDIGGFLEMILSVSTDPTVRNHLFKCCEKALFDKDKVNIDFFEKPDNRQFYYPIMIEVLKINLSPFFDRISSMFANLPGLTEFFQKSK